MAFVAPRRLLPAVALLAGLVVASSPRAANAQSASAQADAAISQGIEFRRQDKNEEALELFKTAYKLSPSPRAKAQIALAQQAIGRWVDAERDLAEAMSHDQDPWIVRQGPILADAMKSIRGHLGDLVVRGDPAGATVELDGEVVGTVPLPRRHVTAGDVVITVRAEGYVPVTRKVNVSAGQESAEVFRLQRVDGNWRTGSADISPVQVHPAEPTRPGNTEGGQNLQTTDQGVPIGKSGLFMAAWGTAIGGGLSLAAGGMFLLLANRNVDKFDDHCFVDAQTNVVKGGGDCSSLNDAFHKDRVIGYTTLAAGAVLAAGSSVLFYKLHSSGKQGSSTQALVGCGLAATRGVSCLLRF